MACIYDTHSALARRMAAFEGPYSAVPSRETRERFGDQLIHPVLTRLLVRNGIHVQREPRADEVEVLDVMWGPRARRES